MPYTDHFSSFPRKRESRQGLFVFRRQVDQRDDRPLSLDGLTGVGKSVQPSMNTNVQPPLPHGEGWGEGDPHYFVYGMSDNEKTLWFPVALYNHSNPMLQYPHEKHDLYRHIHKDKVMNYKLFTRENFSPKLMLVNTGENHQQDSPALHLLPPVRVTSGHQYNYKLHYMKPFQSGPLAAVRSESFTPIHSDFANTLRYNGRLKNNIL